MGREWREMVHSVEANPLTASFALLGQNRLLTPGLGGFRGHGANVFQRGAAGSVVLKGFLGPAQGG